MLINYAVTLHVHKNVMPSHEEITEALSDLVRKKITESGTKSKIVSTFGVEVATRKLPHS